MIGLRLQVRLSPGLASLADDLETELGLSMHEAAGLLVREMQRKVTEVGAVAEGNLRDGIEIESVFPFGASIKAPNVARLIEYGRPPGKVPPWSVFEPILERWARFKGLQIDNLYPIAKKIRERGFRARYPFQRALNTSEGDVKAVFVSRLRVRFR